MLNKDTETYIKDLLDDDNQIIGYRDIQKYKKARCALEFYFMLDHDNTMSIGRWAKRWQVSTSTAFMWVKEFQEVYKRSYRF